MISIVKLLSAAAAVSASRTLMFECVSSEIPVIPVLAAFLMFLPEFIDRFIFAPLFHVDVQISMDPLSPDPSSAAKGIAETAKRVLFTGKKLHVCVTPMPRWDIVLALNTVKSIVEVFVFPHQDGPHLSAEEIRRSKAMRAVCKIPALSLGKNRSVYRICGDDRKTCRSLRLVFSTDVPGREPVHITQPGLPNCIIADVVAVMFAAAASVDAALSIAAIVVVRRILSSPACGKSAVLAIGICAAAVIAISLASLGY